MSDFRIIPSIDELRQRSTVRALEARFGAEATVDALRHAASAVRTAIALGDATLATEASVATRIERSAAASASPRSWRSRARAFARWGRRTRRARRTMRRRSAIGPR